VTKGAFSRCRNKLKPEAFKELNQVGLASFYQEAPWRKWKQWRLLAIDGSTCMLPRHESIEAEFKPVQFGMEGENARSMARTSMLYDVLNLTVLDGQLDDYRTTERELAIRHLEFMVPGQDLTIFDRAYPSLDLMYDMQLRGVDYVIRMKTRWNEVGNMAQFNQQDKEVIYTLKRSKKHPSAATLKLRIVCIDLPEGGKEYLATSILDKTKLAYEDFLDLYHYRWNIEEAYKLLKSRLCLEDFTGKTALAVKQDFFAKLFTMTMMAVCAFPIDEQLKKEAAQDTEGHKHPKQINRTNALALIKENTVAIFLKNQVTAALQTIDKILQKTTNLIRPNRKFKRKHVQKKQAAMNYKRL
jgi:hypothetical protein